MKRTTPTRTQQTPALPTRALPTPTDPPPIDGSLWADAGLVFRREFLTRVPSAMFLASVGLALAMIIGGAVFAKATESQTRTLGLVGSQPAGVVEELPELADDAGYGVIEIPPSLLLVALVWYVVGFAFFGVLIAAGAALAPSQEDAQAVLMPVSVLIFTGYIASVYVSANPDGSIARLVSMVPVVSPFVMPARFLGGDLPLWEHGMALAVAALTLIIAVRVGARVYTGSVIHTDRKLGWLEAYRAEAVR